MKHTLVAIALLIPGGTLSATSSFELTNSEKEVRDSLVSIIPVGSSAIEGKAVLEKNGFACFSARDKDILNGERLNYIYCIHQTMSDSAGERWQVILYHSNKVVKDVKVKYELLD